MITRKVAKQIEQDFFKGKAIIIFGARQVGKTTLTETILKKHRKNVLTFNGDDADIREIFDKPTAVRMGNIVGKNNIVVFDEAQRIPDIGIIMKLFTDQVKDIQVIATGSSSLELADKLNEPLTGRKYEHLLFPISFSEMVDHHGLVEELRQLKHRLIFGYYPEIVTSPGEEIRLLKLLSSSYLYKDIFALNKVKKPHMLDKLVRALALQVGSEVSFNEVSRLIGLDKGTVETYINLLEKAFVVYRLAAYSRNLRNEIKKGQKVYFYDNGILNAIIGNFAPAELRPDIGALWENYVISERIKLNAYRGFYGRSYFWRTTQQQEIDYIEEVDGKLTAFEFKWNPKKKARFPKTFLNAYEIESTMVVTPENIDAFLLG